MGRIKTLLVKRVTNELMELHRDKFTTDYTKNKKVVNTLIAAESKKLVNVITGYVTRLTKVGNKPRKIRVVKSEDSYSPQ